MIDFVVRFGALCCVWLLHALCSAPVASLAACSKCSSQTRTFKDITSRIHVATDENMLTSKDYMVGAGVHAVPTVFIVGKSGSIEWIGLPQDVKPALASVQSGTWNRQKFAETFAGHRRAEIEFQRVSDLMKAGKNADAVALIDKLLPIADSRLRDSLQAIRLQVASGDNRSPKQSE